MKKHANLSIFVPHLGCRQLCSFCDQRAISQTKAQPTAQYVAQLCEQYLPQSGEGVEIAFFGGSFTAIKEPVRVELLSAAHEFVKKGRAQGIRISTRPDAIDDYILAQLQQFEVTAIELGAQSMNDEVLRLNLRGHTSKDVENAAGLIKAAGFSLGLQMMPGLYGVQSYALEAQASLARLLALKPDTMRIYPAVVLPSTALAELYKQHKYTPLSIDEAVEIASMLILQCERAGAKVIRVGLAADIELEKAVIAGPYHPAFRELCESKIFYDIIAQGLCALPKGNYDIKVRNGALSAAKGHKKQNELLFLQKGYQLRLIQNDALAARQIEISTSQ